MPLLKTKEKPVLQLPEKLIHQNVEEVAKDQVFSQERKHPVFVVDLPSKTISMTIGHLEPFQKTRRHRHTYETVIYILEGQGRTIVEEKVIDWQLGDAIYIPVWAWHNHENRGENRCRYVACENAPLLESLGNIGIREEE